MPGLRQSFVNKAAFLKISTGDLNWNPAMDELSRRPQRGPQYMLMQRLLTDMQTHASAWPFLRPVNREEVADYYDVDVSQFNTFEAAEMICRSSNYLWVRLSRAY